MVFNKAAVISLISQKRNLWEVEFDGKWGEVKSIKPINPKYVVKEVV